MPPFVPPSIPKCYAWCLSCGQSFEVVDFGPKWCCIYCDAPSQRLVASATPIRPAVINGTPVVYSVLIRSADKPHCVSLAMPQHVRREPRKAAKAQAHVSPRPRSQDAPARPWGASSRLIDLRAGECRFPLTDEPPHMFCGDRAKAGCSWCAEHAAIVYAPLGARHFALADRMTQEDGR